MEADFLVYNFLVDGISYRLYGYQGRQVYFGPDENSFTISMLPFSIEIDGNGAYYAGPKSRLIHPPAGDFSSRIAFLQSLMEEGFTHVEYEQADALCERVHAHHPIIWKKDGCMEELTFSLYDEKGTTELVIQGLPVYGRE